MSRRKRSRPSLAERMGNRSPIYIASCGLISSSNDLLRIKYCPATSPPIPPYTIGEYPGDLPWTLRISSWEQRTRLSIYAAYPICAWRCHPHQYLRAFDIRGRRFHPGSEHLSIWPMQMCVHFLERRVLDGKGSVVQSKRINAILGISDVRARRAHLWRHLALMLWESRECATVLKYESLTSQPLRTIETILQAIDPGRTSDCPHIQVEVRASSADVLLDAEEDRLIGEICGDVAAKFGY